jgi:hypothetical protein
VSGGFLDNAKEHVQDVDAIRDDQDDDDDANAAICIVYLYDHGDQLDEEHIQC